MKQQQQLWKLSTKKSLHILYSYICSCGSGECRNPKKMKIKKIDIKREGKKKNKTFNKRLINFVCTYDIIMLKDVSYQFSP
jgi:hypothetical protein